MLKFVFQSVWWSSCYKWFSRNYDLNFKGIERGWDICGVKCTWKIWAEIQLPILQYMRPVKWLLVLCRFVSPSFQGWYNAVKRNVYAHKFGVFLPHCYTYIYEIYNIVDGMDSVPSCVQHRSAGFRWPSDVWAMSERYPMCY